MCVTMYAGLGGTETAPQIYLKALGPEEGGGGCHLKLPCSRKFAVELDALEDVGIDGVLDVVFPVVERLKRGRRSSDEHVQTHGAEHPSIVR